MKKLLILTALLLALLLPLTALAGTSVTLDPTVSTADGRTTIRWTPGDFPEGGYKVYVSAVNPGGSAELVQLAGTTSGKSLVTGLMAPNRTYKVYVTSTGNKILGSCTYTMEDVPVFEDGKLRNSSVKVSSELRRLDNNTGRYTILNSFRASTMETALAQDSNMYFCMKYVMRMPQLAKPRSFFVQLVFESPDGYTYTDKATDITFDRVSNGYQTVWWEYAGADFFTNLYRQTGHITAGKYTLTLYWDGCYVNTTTLNIK
jgi:hypothetical protein